MEKKFRYFIAVPITDLDSNHIGQHLKRLRKFLDVKQCTVAEHTEHWASTISDIERHGENPNFLTIQNYVKAIGAEFYAFVPADFLSSEAELTRTRFVLVQISQEELTKIKENT